MFINYITTDQAIKDSMPFIAVSYVHSQYSSLKRQELEIARYLINKFGIRKWPSVWLDRVSNWDSNYGNIIENLKKMNLIYSRAIITLAMIPEVHEAELVNFINKAELYDNNIIENLRNDTKYRNYEKQLRCNVIIKIAYSKWFERAWTFQEQILSSKIECYDGSSILNITTIVHDLIVMNIKGIKQKDIYIKLLSQDSDRLNGRTIYSSFLSNDHEITKSNLILNCKEQRLSLISAMSLVSDRVMGSENIGYEPIESLFKHDFIISDIGVRYNVSIFMNFQKRSSRENCCWLPTRLNTDILYYNNDTFSINYDQSIQLNQGELFLKNNYIWYFGGITQDDMMMFAKLKIKQRTIGCIITHFEKIDLYSADQADILLNMTEMIHAEYEKIIIGMEQIKVNNKIINKKIIKTKVVQNKIVLEWADSKQIIYKDMIKWIIKQVKRSKQFDVQFKVKRSILSKVMSDVSMKINYLLTYSNIKLLIAIFLL